MELLRIVFYVVLLIVGVHCISYAVCTPGHQAWQSLVGGGCLGWFGASVCFKG